MRTMKKGNALRTIASLFGILAGIGGMMHAPGELLQGNIAPGGMFFNSWTLEPIASNVGGEPALSVIPNLFVTGIVTIVISLVEIVWAALFVGRRYGGVSLILLSIAMLLFGGGFAPPLIGIIAGIAGLLIKRKLPAWYRTVFGNRLGLMAKSWPWVFSICAANGMFLVIGSIVFGYILGVRMPNVWVISFLLSIPLLIISIILGYAYDNSAAL